MSQLTANRDTSKIFLFDNEYVKGTFKNNTGGDLDLVGGEVIARDPADGKLVLLDTASTTGLALPLGVNKSCYTALANAGEITMTVGVSGRIAESKLILLAGDSLEDIILFKRLRDRIAGDTAGIFLKATDELTAEDNQ